MTHAILYRPESLGELRDCAYPNELNWSEMSDPPKRVSLVVKTPITASTRATTRKACQGVALPLCLCKDTGGGHDRWQCQCRVRCGQLCDHSVEAVGNLRLLGVER